MRERAALAAFLAFTAAAAITALILITLMRRFLLEEQEEMSWLTCAHDKAPIGDLSPRDLSDLHEEVRRITREAP